MNSGALPPSYLTGYSETLLLSPTRRYRAVHAFDQGDHLVYGTDTELEPNTIVRFDKSTGETEALQTIGGSAIYGCQFGDLLAISTTVEHSAVNRSREAELWLSRDGERWTRVHQARKDIWHGLAFQFGSLVLPTGGGSDETVVFSGQSVRGMDNRIFSARWTPPENGPGATDSNPALIQTPGDGIQRMNTREPT